MSKLIYIKKNIKESQNIDISEDMKNINNIYDFIETKIIEINNVNHYYLYEQKYIIEKKIPLKQRDLIWIIVDNKDQILWIPNLYINKTLGNDNKLYLGLIM